MEACFSEALYDWLNVSLKPHIKSSTLDTYQRRIERYIMPFFETKTAVSISKKDVQEFINYLMDIPLAPATIYGIMGILTSFFEAMVLEERLVLNPCTGIILPKRKKKKIVVFTKKEQQRLIKALLHEHRPRSYLILFALLTGLRLSELCALAWEYVDLENKFIHVTFSTRRIRDQGKTIVILDTPKSDTSIRSIPMTAFMIELLRELQTKKSAYVFSKNNGERYDNRSIQKYFKLLMHELEIKHKNFHTLRHTFATNAIKSGMDIKTLSIILGHSSVSTTMNLYVHPDETYMRKALETMATQIIRK